AGVVDENDLVFANQSSKHRFQAFDQRLQVRFAVVNRHDYRYTTSRAQFSRHGGVSMPDTTDLVTQKLTECREDFEGAEFHEVRIPFSLTHSLVSIGPYSVS